MLASLARGRVAAGGDDVLEPRARCRPRSSPTLAARHFAEVEVEPDPAAALARAREHGPVLVTGSLYLLADLSFLKEPRLR